jgi:hypothetical protein
MISAFQQRVPGSVFLGIARAAGNLIHRMDSFMFAILTAALLVGYAQAQVEYVDPTIGNVGILLVPTRPTVYLPNSMVRMYPIRTDGVDDQIRSFPLTISSHRISELFSIMPGDGNTAAYDQEKTTPYYYSVRFRNSDRVLSGRALWLLSLQFCG